MMIKAYAAKKLNLAELYLKGKKLEAVAFAFEVNHSEAFALPCFHVAMVNEIFRDNKVLVKLITVVV